MRSEKKLENSEKTHTDMGRTWELHTDSGLRGEPIFSPINIIYNIE